MVPPATKAAEPSFYAVSSDGFLVIPCDEKGGLLPVPDPFALSLDLIGEKETPTKSGIVYSDLTHTALAAQFLNRSPLSVFALVRLRSLETVRHDQACKLIALRSGWHATQRRVCLAPHFLDVGVPSVGFESLCRKLVTASRRHIFLPVPVPRFTAASLPKLRC